MCHVCLCNCFSGLPRWLSGKESACQCKETQEMLFWSLGWEDPLEKEIAIHLPGKSHGQRSLVGYSLWGCTESNTTEPECTHAIPWAEWTTRGIGSRLEEKSSSVLKKHLDADGSLDSGLLTLIMSFLVSHWGAKKNYPKNKLKKIKKRKKYPRGSAFIHRIPIAGAHTSQDSLSQSARLPRFLCSADQSSHHTSLGSLYYLRRAGLHCIICLEGILPKNQWKTAKESCTF